MKPLVTIPKKSHFIGSLCEPAFHGHFRSHSNQYMICSQFYTINNPHKFHSAHTVTAYPFWVQKFTTTRFQDLGPIKQLLTASFNSNICRVFKRGNKTKKGETPTSWSLRKLHKSGTHGKPSPRRAVLLLVSKTADDRIVRIF